MSDFFFLSSPLPSPPPLPSSSSSSTAIHQTKDFNSEAVDEQTDQALKNMGEILKAGGCTFDDVIKTTVLLADIKDFATVNGVYAKYFSTDPPARTAFAVRELPLGAKVEIECIAACK